VEFCWRSSLIGAMQLSEQQKGPASLPGLEFSCSVIVSA